MSSGKDTLSLLSIASVSTTPDGKILEINDQARRDLRIGGGEIPLSISGLVSVCHGKQELIPKIFDRLRQHDDPGDLPEWTTVRRCDSDLKFYIQGRFIGRYDDRGRLHRVLFLFRNIGEEITRRFVLDMALAQTRIFPWFFDPDDNKMTIDVRWFRHLGIADTADTISAETFFGFVHPDDRAMLLDAFTRQLSGALDDKWYSYRLRRGDGEWEWFETQSVYLGRSDDGSPCRVVGICQSIQSHKTIENALIEARDRARDSDRLKSMFLANMSHEIRTPLNAIIGFANLLTNEEYPLDEDEKKEYSRLITTNGEQLLRLISDILDLSKIESNTMEFNFADFSVTALLTDIYQAQKLNMRPGVELRLELPDEDIRIDTDAERLKQVINNLINNAVKFTDKGSITFGCRTCGNGTTAELFVNDTGRGIEEEHLERIFDRFYKADSFVKGVGLGLSICRTIAESLGGSISVTSRPGQGTRFTLRHPLRQPQPEAEAVS